MAAVTTGTSVSQWSSPQFFILYQLHVLPLFPTWRALSCKDQATSLLSILTAKNKELSFWHAEFEISIEHSSGDK